MLLVSINFAVGSILEQALNIFHSSEHGKPRVTEIKILTDTEHYARRDEIRLVFGLEAAGTPAESAKLVFQRPDPHLGCRYCKKIFPYPEKSSSPYGDLNLNCPRCGSADTQLLSFEIMVQKIKIG